MSALGQKRTSTAPFGLVRFVPKADIASVGLAPVTSEPDEIFDAPTDRVSDRRSGKKYKFRVQPAGSHDRGDSEKA